MMMKQDALHANRRSKFVSSEKYSIDNLERARIVICDQSDLDAFNLGYAGSITIVYSQSQVDVESINCTLHRFER